VLLKDACMHLVVALAGPADTQDSINAGIVEQFFTSQVAPELQAEQLPKNKELIRASCLKYVTVLRTVLPTQCVLGITPCVTKHILAENPVIHTYAAVCANLISAMKDSAGNNGQKKSKFEPQVLRPFLLPTVVPMLHILCERRGIAQNEVLARALVAIFVYLELEAMELAPQALRLLTQLISGVLVPSPSNPDCIHATFECLALVLKLLVPAGSSEVEGVVLPVLGRIWEQGTEELMPYSFQIFALLIDLAPSPCAASYSEVFSRIVGEDPWRTPGNVPGLVRLLRAFFFKHHFFGSLISANMPAIFERFHLTLGHRHLVASAFALLNAMLRYLPLEFYQQYFQTAITLALARMQSKKSIEFEKEFVICLSLFVFTQPDPEALPTILGQLRPGMLPQFMTQVWLPAATKVLLLQRRKICVVGLAKLMTCGEIRNNAQLLSSCCESLAGLLRWKNAGLMSWLSTFVLPRLAGDEPREVVAYSVPYSRLLHGEPSIPWCDASAVASGGASTSVGTVGWDILPEIKDRGVGIAIVRDTLAPVKPMILALERVPAAITEVWQ